ncbi:hypothetical protein ABLO16_20520, partial [Mycobacterium tuberculosis]
IPCTSFSYQIWVFNLNQEGKARCFRIYRETLSRFSCAASVTVPQLVRGDYMNLSLTLDLTYSAIDNAFLTGTGFSGALRALEQSFGRDPETMIPDIRYTPNPNDAPGGPLVERGNRQC